MSDLPCALILTALGKEFTAVRDEAKTSFTERCHPAGTVYEVGPYPKDSPKWEIALVETGRGGQNAAVEAHRGIEFLQPSVILTVGVAGGIKDVSLGDVVAATKVYAYEAGKVTEAGAESVFLPRPELGESSHRLVQRARALARNRNWLVSQDGAVDQVPIAYVEPMVTGKKLVAAQNHEVNATLSNYYGDAVALDMESYDVLRVAYSSSVDCLAVRGVSDLLVGKTEADHQGGQERAAARAAAFALRLLRDLDATGYGQRHGPIDELGTEIVPTGEANPILEELGRGLDSYSYRGDLGRYPRTAIVGQMVDSALRAGTAPSLAVQLILLDPSNEHVLNRYADHQRSQGIPEVEIGLTNIEQIRDEILATIVRMYAWKGAYPKLDLDIRLTAHFTLIRVDLCPSLVLITKDNPIEPMIVLRPPSAFYKTFKDEVALSAAQAARTADGVRGIDPSQLNLDAIVTLLQDLDLGVGISRKGARRILDLARDDAPPYSRPAIGIGFDKLQSRRGLP